jgi:hypothetical protein
MVMGITFTVVGPVDFFPPPTKKSSILKAVPTKGNDPSPFLKNEEELTAFAKLSMADFLLDF